MTLAQRLLMHAAAVMPPRRRAWIEAIQAELPAITDEREALAFALGGVLTAYRERISPMRLVLLITRLSIAAVTIATAIVHAAFPAYFLAVFVDLKLNGMSGWAGRFHMWRGRTVGEAMGLMGTMPLWHLAAFLLLAGALGAAAWSLARWNPRRLMLAIATGAAVAVANELALRLSWPLPFVVHPTVFWLDYVAFALLAAAGGAIWALSRQRAEPARADA
ncbi:hypothetical protein [uncultured Caulobacter sp.]|uniref:hypothetical protein n=1 Tax=uncultured Caulobacter sp. TaxID=158749 RepID=UPI00262FD1C6|nr:hypothetical protein [uncultured Caulobacter sp.]